MLLEPFLKCSQPLACCQRRLDRATNPNFNYNCLPHHLHRIDLDLEFPFNCIILNLIHLTNEQLQKFSFLLLPMFWTTRVEHGTQNCRWHWNRRTCLICNLSMYIYVMYICAPVLDKNKIPPWKKKMGWKNGEYWASRVELV